MGKGWWIFSWQDRAAQFEICVQHYSFLLTNKISVDDSYAHLDEKKKRNEYEEEFKYAEKVFEMENNAFQKHMQRWNQDIAAEEDEDEKKHLRTRKREWADRERPTFKPPKRRMKSVE